MIKIRSPQNPRDQNPIGTEPTPFKTRSPQNIGTHSIKTPSEWNPRNQNPISIYADQNSIGTYPISFRRSKLHLNPPKIETHLATLISMHDPHAPWWTLCKTAQAAPVASLEQEREWVQSHTKREPKWECWERLKREWIKKQYLFLELSYSTILHLRWYCSTIVNFFTILQFYNFTS